eukprot:Nk52_evm5s96 gene=Nk52_evmTU5s96
MLHTVSEPLHRQGTHVSSSNSPTGTKWDRFAPFLRVGCDFTDLFVSIPRTETVLDTTETCGTKLSHYTLYHVKVQLKDSGHRFRKRVKERTFPKRYRQFRALYECLNGKYPGVLEDPEFPKFPPKRLFNNTNEKRVEERRKALERFLRALVSNDLLRNDLATVDFLHVKDIQQEIMNDEAKELIRKQCQERNLMLSSERNSHSGHHSHCHRRHSPRCSQGEQGDGSGQFESNYSCERGGAGKAGEGGVGVSTPGYNRGNLRDKERTQGMGCSGDAPHECGIDDYDDDDDDDGDEFAYPGVDCAECAMAESASFKEKYLEAKQQADIERERRTSEGEEWLKILQNTEKEQLLHCKICYDTRVEVALQPCGHSLMCETCARKFAACPICRMFITKRLRIYL